MTEETRKPVLTDHVRVKQKLISPFVAAMGGTYAPYSWTRQLVPEAIWLALVIDRHGFDTATRNCLGLITTASRIVNRQDAPMFATLSAFSTLTKAQMVQIAAELDTAATDNLRSALAPLSALIADQPLAFLDGEHPIETADDDRFARVLDEVYDRNSRLAVLSMALAYYLGVQQGKVLVAPHLVDELIRKFAVIGDYPESEAAREAAGSFRASAPMLFLSPQDDDKKLRGNDAWTSSFWEHVAGFGSCAYPDTLSDEPLDGLDGIQSFIVGFRNAVRTDLRARLEVWTLDLNEVEAYEVIGALLARQAALTLDLSGAPTLWTPHSAPILLRAMADVFINLAWILKNPNERARTYVEDGLGAVKLMIAHQERAIADAEDSSEIEQMQSMIKMWRGWLDSQRLDAFVEVNLGSWSGVNTRRMAEEAGFIDFYNHVYQPFSSAVHSNWFHVSTFNMVYCENPAHRGHRVPAIAPIEPDTHWLFLAAKYLRKTLAHFDEFKGFTGVGHASFDYMYEPEIPSAPPDAATP